MICLPEPSRPAFDAPAFAKAVRDLMASVRDIRLAQLQAILDANEKGDRQGIVRIVSELMEEERCAA
jgi:hypothetical protein